MAKQGDLKNLGERTSLGADPSVREAKGMV